MSQHIIRRPSPREYLRELLDFRSSSCVDDGVDGFLDRLVAVSVGWLVDGASE